MPKAMLSIYADTLVCAFVRSLFCGAVVQNTRRGTALASQNYIDAKVIGELFM